MHYNSFACRKRIYITSYSTYIETFSSLSPTVFEIFDFIVFRVWLRTLIFRGHLESKYVCHSKKIYDFLTNLYWPSSLYRIPFPRTFFGSKFRRSLNGIKCFQSQGHQQKFFISKQGSYSRQTMYIDASFVKISITVLLHHQQRA